MPRRSSAARVGPLVTLTSDVGAAYAAQMKAVLLRTVPPERLVDLTHELRAHDVVEAAFLLRAMASLFPAGTVHLAVVDPGVGGRRAPLVIRCSDGSVLIGPDNGLLMPLASRLGGPRAYRLDPRKVPARARVGTTFDGRDLFAPAAAAVAGGRRAETLGAPVEPRPFLLPEPERERSGARGQILHVDRFGNAISNIPAEWVPAGTPRLEVSWRGRRRRPAWVRQYEGVGEGTLVALGSSFGTVELARNRDSAAEKDGLRVGTRLAVAWGRRRHSMGK